MLWGAAFESIADEGERSLTRIGRTVDAITAAGTPQLALASLGNVPTLTVVPAALPFGVPTGSDGASAPNGDIVVHSTLELDGQPAARSVARYSPQETRRNRRVNQ
jgi:hypothetical protein